MPEKVTDKLKNATTFFQTVQGMLTIVGAIIGMAVGGYYWLHDTIVERNAHIISRVSIEQIRAEVDPMPKKLYMNLRVKDSLERQNLEWIALEFMNRQDSLVMVMVREMRERRALADQVARIEAKIDASRLPKKEDQLERIWEYLKSKEVQDSTDQKLDEMMRQIRQINQQKIDGIKTGDRIK